MPRYSRYGAEGGPLLTVARRVVPWVVFAVLLFWVFGLYSAYRAGQPAWDAEQNKPKPSELVSATASPPAKPPPPGKPVTAGASKTSRVVVLSSVTLRKDPSATAASIRDLTGGEQLTLVGQAGAWYKVSDSKGIVGWVSASGKYTKVVSGK